MRVFYIRDNLPAELAKNDFQDFPQWRKFNASMLNYICSEYKGVVICPMTITNLTYLDEIREAINRDVEIRHFTLIAEIETLTKRLKGRGEKENTWVFHQIERCANTLSDQAFKEHIVTDHLTIDEVVQKIADSCEL